MATPIFSPATVAFMVLQLTPAETDELEAYTGADREITTLEEQAQFVTRTCEWLRRWQARKLGGGLG